MKNRTKTIYFTKYCGVGEDSWELTGAVAWWRHHDVILTSSIHECSIWKRLFFLPEDPTPPQWFVSAFRIFPTKELSLWSSWRQSTPSPAKPHQDSFEIADGCGGKVQERRIPWCSASPIESLLKKEQTTEKEEAGRTRELLPEPGSLHFMILNVDFAHTSPTPEMPAAHCGAKWGWLPSASLKEGSSRSSHH